jgi:putative phage-type endonuclease
MTRPLKIGGSDIAKVVGVSPYGGPVDVYRRIVEGHEVAQTQPMRRGQLLEPVVRAMYVEATGTELEPHPGVIESKRYPWMMASVDDLAKPHKIAEYKSANFRTLHRWGEEGSDEVPEEYALQCHYYMCATDRPEADVAVLIAGDTFRVYHLRRDLEIESFLIEAAERFWKDHILTKRPPPPDATDAYADYLKAKFPGSNGHLLPATNEARDVVRRLAEAKAEKSAAEEEERRWRNELVALLGDADGFEGLCTYKATKGRAVTDWKAVCAEAKVAAEIIERNTSRAPFRTLRLKGQNHGNE